MTQGKPGPSDQDLVAYIDGELSPAESVRIGQQLAGDAALKDRLDELMAGGRPFASAFGLLLDGAPTARLETALARAVQAQGDGRRGPGMGRLGLIAAALAILAVGAGADRMIETRWVAPPVVVQGEPESADWRKAVADYLALYTPNTLARIFDRASERELAGLGQQFGLALSPAKVALGGLPLKRADLYDYDGRPLAFLAFLDPQQGPLALCIIEGGTPSGRKFERRQDMNVVYWSEDGHSFMLIGRSSPDRLQTLAADVQARFAPKG